MNTDDIRAFVATLEKRQKDADELALPVVFASRTAAKAAQLIDILLPVYEAALRDLDKTPPKIGYDMAGVLGKADRRLKDL